METVDLLQRAMKIAENNRGLSMATQKPISTISYNSEKFLKEKLTSWYNAHIIQAYQYILHKGEDGDKDHIHLRIEPNKRVDPMSLSEDLKEFEAGKEKPRGCRPWRPSKRKIGFFMQFMIKNI